MWTIVIKIESLFIVRVCFRYIEKDAAKVQLFFDICKYSAEKMSTALFHKAEDKGTISRHVAILGVTLRYVTLGHFLTRQSEAST